MKGRVEKIKIRGGEGAVQRLHLAPVEFSQKKAQINRRDNKMIAINSTIRENVKDKIS